MKKKLIVIAVTCAFLSSILIVDSYSISKVVNINPPPKIEITSKVKKFKYSLVNGKGPLPYNYRIIDNLIHAGGHPLNPVNYANTNKQALEILSYLKSKGVKTVINIDSTSYILKRYRKLLEKLGLKELHIPMHAKKVPTAKEWENIKNALKEPVYIHCKWGADRTGSIIAKYLVDIKHYSPKDAWKAVISGGSHSGVIGGLKKYSGCRKLVLFFWPDALKDKEMAKYYK